MKGFWTKNKYKIFTAILLIIMLFAFEEYIVKYAHLFKEPEKIKDIILSYGHYSSLAFIVLQIIQIVFFFIPGEFVQIIGGYIFGSFGGFLYSIIGITIGSILTFGIARLIGRKSVEKMVFKNDKWLFKKLDQIKKDNKKLKELVFIMYLIPGIPKDILGYICGVTKLTLKEFLIISVCGRMPALLVSCFFGDKFSKDNMILLIIIGVLCIAILAVSIVKGKAFISEYGENK